LGGVCTPCAGFNLPHTQKQRIDRSLVHAGAFPTKIVSFMWVSLYDCTSTSEADCSRASLSQQIVDDRQRPILSTAAIHPSNHSLELRGFNLQVFDDAVQLNITCQGGALQKSTAVVPLTRVEADFGAVTGLVPILQRGWSPLPPWAWRKY
jgi:hypothetical protein